MIPDLRGFRIGVLLLCWTAVGATAQGTAPENSSIRADRLRADLMFLAGDGFRGRLTKTPENTLATEWIKSRFERLGLKPMGQGGSYFAENNLRWRSSSARRRRPTSRARSCTAMADLPSRVPETTEPAND